MKSFVLSLAIIMRFTATWKTIGPYHSAAMLSLGGIKSFVFAHQSLGQMRIQCEAYRAKTKLFILLRLDLAAE